MSPHISIFTVHTIIVLPVPYSKTNTFTKFQEYKNAEGQVGTFKNSQFLVFANRILAFILSLVAILTLNQPRHTVPYYKYIYCSFSNIMSSWCQYEALKFISFPTQVLIHSFKHLLCPVADLKRRIARNGPMPSGSSVKMCVVVTNGLYKNLTKMRGVQEK